MVTLTQKPTAMSRRKFSFWIQNGKAFPVPYDSKGKQEFKHKNMNIKEAVDVLVDALKLDDEYKYAWQANIAMAFKDEFWNHQEKGTVINVEFMDEEESSRLIHIIANRAAIRFLDQLTYKPNE